MDGVRHVIGPNLAAALASEMGDDWQRKLGEMLNDERMMEVLARSVTVVDFSPAFRKRRDSRGKRRG